MKNCKVWTVLYNDESTVKEITEIPFREHSVHSLYTTKSASGQPSYLGEVVSVPTGTIACADHAKLQAFLPSLLQFEPQSFCNDRGFEQLPGLVDFRGRALVEAGGPLTLLKDGDAGQAHAVCQLVPADQSLLELF